MRAKAHLLAAKVASSQGEMERAADHAAEAREFYQRVGATRAAGRAEAVLAHSRQQ